MGYAAAACCAVLAVFDVRSGRIPNRLVFIFGAAGLLGSLLLGGGQRVLSSLFGAAAMFFLLWILYALRLMGAGDVKMMMMLGIFCGWPGVLAVFAASILAGSVYAVVRFLRRRGWKARFGKLAAYLGEVRAGGRPEAYFRAAEKDARVSFAVFAAAGTIICVLLGVV